MVPLMICDPTSTYMVVRRNLWTQLSFPSWGDAFISQLRDFRDHNLSGILLERLIFMTNEKMSLSNALLVTGHDIFMDNKLQTAIFRI